MTHEELVTEMPNAITRRMEADTPTAAGALESRATSAGRPSLAGRVPPTVLILCSITSVQLGAAMARHLFALLGPGGTVLPRVGFAALILTLTQGGLPRRVPRRALLVAMLFGLDLACMNFAFYQSLDRIPLGIAVTVEFAGPLAVAVVGSRRAVDFVWVVLAAVGIVLFAPWSGAALDPFGVVLALVAAGFWAAYIFLSQRLGQVFPDRRGLTLAMWVATLATLPVGIASAGAALLSPVALAAGCGVALLSSAIPYSLEIEALRRLPTHIFGILMSLEPAMATLVGIALLGEQLNPRNGLALVLVTSASLGVTWKRRQGA